MLQVSKRFGEIAFIFTILFVPLGKAFAQENINVSPGVDRWAVKTSMGTGQAKNVPLSDLLSLPLLDPQYNFTTYGATLIPVKLTPGIKEGDIITTTGYLRLVALEDASGTHADGDYHIQLTVSGESKDSCFIVEIPYPDFIKNNAMLKDSAEGRRSYVRQKLVKGSEPSPTGNVMQHVVHVKVTGQLFYDATHAPAMRGSNPTFRGKKGMHSYTAWELHPLKDLEIIKP